MIWLRKLCSAIRLYELLGAVVTEIVAFRVFPPGEEPEWYFYAGVYLGALILGAVIGRFFRWLIQDPRDQRDQYKQELDQTRRKVQALKRDRPTIAAELVEISSYTPRVEGSSLGTGYGVRVRNNGAPATFYAQLSLIERVGAHSAYVQDANHHVLWRRGEERETRLVHGEDNVACFGYLVGLDEGGAAWGLSRFVQGASGTEVAAGPEDTAGVPIDVEVSITSDPPPTESESWTGRFRIFRDGCTRLDD